MYTVIMAPGVLSRVFHRLLGQFHLTYLLGMLPCYLLQVGIRCRGLASVVLQSTGAVLLNRALLDMKHIGTNKQRKARESSRNAWLGSKFQENLCVRPTSDNFNPRNGYPSLFAAVTSCRTYCSCGVCLI